MLYSVVQNPMKKAEINDVIFQCDYHLWLTILLTQCNYSV